jgi:membrane protein implicated in regulation of membrane protease activity
MPVIVLPIFWLMPLNLAVPIYVVIALVSGLLYWLITRSMMKPVATGSEELIGTGAEVVSRLSSNNYTKYLVRAGGELWTARSANSLLPGEQVNIAAMDGIRLVVESSKDSTQPNHVSGEETTPSGAMKNE